MTVQIIKGDCRTALQALAPFDMLLADPPYGDTSLKWDRRCEGWIEVASDLVSRTGSMWVFGSMRFFQDVGPVFKSAGWQFAQDLVWEKQNGSGFAIDRFKRVHEHVVQYYRIGTRWSEVFNEVQRIPRTGPDKSGARRRRVPHTGEIGPGEYNDDGFRIMRSVVAMANMNGRAIHPTEKPSGLIEILIRTSCPPSGTVADLFAGSGSAGEAAMRAGRQYVGTEIEAAMAAKANDRLAGLLPLVCG